MRVLLTGATGFVGNMLLAQLGRHEVACLGRSRPTLLPEGVIWIDADLMLLEAGARKAIEEFAPECCVHLAWAGLPDYSLGWCLDNLCAGAKLFEFLREVGCKKIIGAGSCWEYGDCTGPVAESSIGAHVNLFATNKMALREIGQSLLQAADLQFIWTRIFFVYGMRQRPTSLIPSVIRALMLGETPKIGTPSAVNDFIHVQDVALALLCLIESEDARGIYNIGSGVPASVADVVNEIADQTGRHRLYKDTGSNKALGFWADINRLHALGWTPGHTLKSGISQVVTAWGALE